MKRRTFLSVASVGALASIAPAWAAKKPKPLKILILGGTRFIGLHMTALALARGHTLTFFNRGKTGTDRYPEVERIKGDRNGEIDGLKNREWDVVIDNSGYVPRHVRLSAELLAPKVKQYLFISSISVYPDFSVARNEDSPVGKLADESVEKVDGETYGPLKALCEQAASKAFPGRATVIRPGLIVGPDDNTDRFTYWPARAARGGEFIAPGAPTDAFQVIDVRDLAAFTLAVVENNVTGTYNAVSNVNEFKFGELTDACIAAARKQAKPASTPRAIYLPAEFLEEQKVEPWSEMPVWLPAKGEEAAFAGTSNKAAVAKGLKITPIKKTVNDTLAWHLTRPAEEREKLKSGIAPEKEATVLAAWKAKKS
ncbi:MAG TPA: NAD-dependent epimerase/dehydratase family protein [Steroidobacteraceae bacterium]|jgi:2'-hydroxyisoflavone reductase|nr:NAD-dependent epimerase/dehydratase family protein [Steroidobacteraceae bacterium]